MEPNFQKKTGPHPRPLEKTKDTKGVGKEFRNYYEMLYKEKKTDAGCEYLILKRMAAKKILTASKEMLDAPIQVDEVAKVMEHLPVGKQPGPNRIPNAVYKYMSRHFAPKLTEVLNATLQEQALPKHFLEGDISMLYKKGDRADPRNYRPITLLNTDYKIFTRVLAIRMREVVHEFVEECQKGFMPKTFISEATMLLRLVEAHINEEPTKRKGIFLFLDMEKAFDRVSYDFTNKALEAYGFGKNFRTWVGLMYNVQKPP